jgi:hypothetical protein
MTKTILTTISAAAIAMAAFTPAKAAEKTMPIHFVGDWCFSSLDNKTTEYKLPSWTEDGHCTKSKILSIDQYGFYGGDIAEGRSCDLVNVRLTKDTAPSGTAYMAIITARCYPQGVVITKADGVILTFEFERYKGTLSVTPR